MNRVDIWRKSVKDTRGSRCRGTEVGVYVACLRHSKEASVAGEK